MSEVPSMKVKQRERLLGPGLALLLFIYYMVIYFVQHKLITHDATLWINYGVQLFSGSLQQFNFNGGAPVFSPLIWTPGYPGLLGFLNIFLNNPVFSAYLASLLGAVGLALVVFYFTKDLFNKITAVYAFILTGLYPVMFEYATSTVIRPVALFFLYIGLYFIYKLIKHGKASYAIWAGVAMGLTIVTRFEFAFYGVVVGGVLLERLLKKVVSLKSILIYIVVMGVVYSLYAIPLYRVTGYVGLSPYISRMLVKEPFPEKEHINRENYKKANVAMRNVLYNKNTASRMNLLNQHKVQVQPEVSIKTEKKVNVKKRGLWRNYIDLFVYLLPQLLLKLVPFILLGIFYLYRNGRIRQLSLLMIITGTTFVFFPLFGGARGLRYYTQVYPFFFMVSAYGISGAHSLVRKRVTLPYIGIVFGCLLAAFLVLWNVREVPREYSKKDTMWLDVAEYLKTHGKPDDIVFARKRFPAFYSGLRSELLPDEQDIGAIYQYAMHVGADYLVIDKAVTCVAMPQYLPLLGENYPEYLKLVKEVHKNTESYCRIFQFKKSAVRTEEKGTTLLGGEEMHSKRVLSE